MHSVLHDTNTKSSLNARFFKRGLARRVFATYEWPPDVSVGSQHRRKFSGLSLQHNDPSSSRWCRGADMWARTNTDVPSVSCLDKPKTAIIIMKNCLHQVFCSMLQVFTFTRILSHCFDEKGTSYSQFMYILAVPLWVKPHLQVTDWRVWTLQESSCHYAGQKLKSHPVSGVIPEGKNKDMKQDRITEIVQINTIS